MTSNFYKVFHPTQNRYAFIDGIRAIAVIYIVIFHLFWFAGFYIPVTIFESLIQLKPFTVVIYGDLAVDMFFTISGFLIASILLSEYKKYGSLHISRFYIKRYARLMPVYFVSMMIALIYMAISPNLLFGDPAFMWANLLYLNNYVPVENMFLGWTWSFAVEEQFYLLFPFALLLILKMKRSIPPLMAITGLFILSTVIIALVVMMNTLTLPAPYSPALGLDHAMLFAKWFNCIYVPSYTRFGPFVCGFAVAYLHHYHAETAANVMQKYRYASIMLFLTFAIIMAIIYLTPIHTPVSLSRLATIITISTYKNSYGIAISIIILMCLYPSHFIGKAINNALSAKIWYPIAQVSYSVSIFHPIAIFLVYPHFYSRISTPTLGNIVFASASVFAISFGVAIVTYVLIERPIIDLVGEFFKKRSLRSQEDGLAAESCT